MSARSIWVAAGVPAIAVVAVVVVISAGGSGPNVTGSAAQGERDRAAPISLTALDGERAVLPAGRPGALFFTVSSCLSCVPSGQALVEGCWRAIPPHPRQRRRRRLLRLIKR